MSEPGWFDLAFLTQDDPPRGEPSVTVDHRVPPPFQLLIDALDGMVHAGVLGPDRCAHAEWVCWSGVHGFADIATRGPLRGQDRVILDALAGNVVETIIDGLVA